MYDKTFTRRRPVVRLLDLTAVPRHMGVSTAQFTVDADNDSVPLLMEPGARAVVKYRGDLLVSGTIDVTSAVGPTSSATRTFTVIGYYAILGTTAGWQVPAAAITAQNAAEYDVATGPAETVVKDLVGANATRLGLPLTIAPDLGRGDTITVSTRMHTLDERLTAVVESAGIGITIEQQDGGLVLDCYETAWYPHALTERSGAVTAWSHQTAAPTVTRVVVALGGEGLARVYRQFVDTAREALWGVVREVVVDARDIAPDDPDLDAVAAARAAEALAAGAPTSGLTVTLAETSVFRYGTFRVGDLVSVEIGFGQVVTDVLRSAQITWTVGQGLEVTPQIGAISDDPDEITAAAIRATADRVNRLSVER